MNNYERDAAIAQQVLEQALPAAVAQDAAFALAALLPEDVTRYGRHAALRYSWRSSCVS